MKTGEENIFTLVFALAGSRSRAGRARGRDESDLDENPHARQTHLQDGDVPRSLTSPSAPWASPPVAAFADLYITPSPRASAPCPDDRSSDRRPRATRARNQSLNRRPRSSARERCLTRREDGGRRRDRSSDRVESFPDRARSIARVPRGVARDATRSTLPRPRARRRGLRADARASGMHPPDIRHRHVRTQSTRPRRDRSHVESRPVDGETRGRTDGPAPVARPARRARGVRSARRDDVRRSDADASSERQGERVGE